MTRQSYILVFTLALILFSCKSSKTIAASGNANYNLSTNQLVKAHKKQLPEFKTLQSRLKITLSEGEKTQSHTVSFRMKKDEVIWISAALSIVKAMITPEKVSFYNKLDKTYFEGDFSYLSDLLGTDLDFDKAQNLLLGETLFDLEEQPYTVSVLDSSYVLQPKKQNKLFEIFYILDPIRYQVKSQQISQVKEYRHLQIDYESYQSISNQTLPETIRVVAVEGNDEAIINLELKGVSLNEDLRFPFKIPSGYKAIELK